MSNTKITVKESLPNESRTESSQKPQYSAISELSSLKGTPKAIRDWLISSQEGFPVSPSQSPASEKEPKTNETCGLKRLSAFASYDPDTHSLKTYPDLFPVDMSEQSSVTWPNAVIMISGIVYSARMTLEHRTEGSGCGYWPTPRSNENDQGFRGEESSWLGQNRGETLSNAVKRWPTPDTNCWKQGERGTGTGGGPQLSDHFVKMWPSPQAMDSIHRSYDSFKGVMERHRQGRKMPPKLADIAHWEKWKMWPTPKGSPSGPDFARMNRPDSGGDDLATSIARREAGSLNPDWVEWLMNWPIGWSSLEPMTEIIWLDWSVDPADDGSIPRTATGVKDRVNRLKSIGNGQVSLSAATAFRLLIKTS